MSDQPTVAISSSQITLIEGLRQAARRRPCLVLFSGEETDRPFVLEPGLHVIGRAADVQVHIDNPGISRRHVQLSVDQHQVVLVDLGSHNGTHVNERRVHEPCVLQEGDLLRLGSVLLKFYTYQSLDAALHDRIYRLATIDPGTEVFNRRYLFDTLRREIRLAQRGGWPLSVLCCDLDRFKSVNDSYGHPAGDRVLKAAASALRDTLQGAGTLGRLGGEEFGVVLPHTDLAQAADWAERLRQAVSAQPVELELPGASSVASEPGTASVSHRQTVSIGVASLTASMSDVTQLLEAADRRLYAAKQGGRDRVCS